MQVDFTPRDALRSGLPPTGGMFWGEVWVAGPLVALWDGHEWVNPATRIVWSTDAAERHVWQPVPPGKVRLVIEP